ncbi:MAG: DUF4111 domain-containing protein [Clostridia bacterium]|nr:DUF4111 domain-containing protein [Clostridia bacterium]
METKELLKTFVSRCKQILKDELCGVYLHGSAVMDCFNAKKSDTDLIVVVNNGIPDEVKRAFMEMTVELDACAPRKGIEMSVVRADVCDPFVYPTPYELHFSKGHLERYTEDPDGYIREMKGTDRDLAAHFTVIRKRGRCLYGPPVEEVFGEVPARDYLDSIWFDVEDAREDIKDAPTYIILNLARVSAYCEEGTVLSKKEGGEWAIGNLPERFRPLIRSALDDYTASEDVEYGTEDAAAYAEYMIERIKRKTDGLQSDN